MPTRDSIEAQEASLRLPRFDLGVAVKLGNSALALANESGLPVTIEIRASSRIAYRAALPGTGEENDDWLQRKFRVVTKFGVSSLAVWADYELQGLDFNAATQLNPAEYAAVGGGWPIKLVNGDVVGLFGVSGLPHLDDHELIVNSLNLLLSNPGKSALRSSRNSRSW
jgi:uncharacterized protein (UPF0303 family)